MDKETEGHVIRENEPNLYDYWRVILKRKTLIISLFLICVILAALISFISPKIYRGIMTLRIVPKDLVTPKEIIDITGKLDREKINIICPQHGPYITSVKLLELKGSTDKFQAIIDSRDIKMIDNFMIQLDNYLNSYLMLKRFVEQYREQLMKQTTELSGLIEESETMQKTFEIMLRERKLLPMGFNPVDLNRKVSDLKIEKIRVEQTIKNLTALEVLEKYSSKNPVGPRVIRNIVLAGLIGIFAGIFLAFFKEFIDKVKLQQLESEAENKKQS